MIRASTFTDTWPIVTLGQVVDFLDHKRVPVTKADRVPGEYAYYGANGAQGTINDFIFDEPLVLVAEDGGNFGNPDRTIAYIATGKYWVNNHAHVLKPKDGLDLKYLCRVLEKYDVTPYVKGATRQKLSKTDASRIPIPLPPLETQKQIAAVLEKADQLRKDCQQMEQELNNLAQSVFMDMFGDDLVGVLENTLGEVADVISGVTKGQKLDGKTTSTVPYMRVANVQAGYLNLDEIKDITVKESDVEKYKLIDGDVLLTEGGDYDKLGRGAIWRGEVVGCIHQNHVFRVRLNSDLFLPEWLNGYLKTALAKRYFLRCAKKTTNLASINITQLKGLPMPDISVARQTEFVDVIDSIEKKAELNEKLRKELDQNFNSLMQRAFNGELDLPTQQQVA